MLARAGVIAGGLLSSSGCLLVLSTSDLSGGGSPDAESVTPAAGDAAPETGSGVIDRADAADDGSAEAGVVWPVNDHRYVVWTFDEAKRWDQARDEAVQAGGHLVTITSEDEQQFVMSLLRPELLQAAYGPWIGAYQPDPATAQEPTGGWAWVTGEPWSYTRWGTGEPNNLGPEHFAHLSVNGVWNDTTINAANGVTSAIVEFE